MEIAVVWLLVIAPMLIGLGAAIWWGNGNKTVALWIGVAGMIVFVLAGGVQIQHVISKEAESTGPSPNEIAISQARAYVFVENIETTNIDDDMMNVGPTKIAHATIIIGNSGQTPATQVKHRAHIRLAAFPPPEGFFDVPKPAANSVFTLQKGGHGSITAGLGRPLTIDEKTTLGLGIMAVYVFGEISYDSFGVRRCTHYRYMVGGSVGFNGNRMSQMAEGNYTDKNCSP